MPEPSLSGERQHSGDCTIYDHHDDGRRPSRQRECDREYERGSRGAECTQPECRARDEQCGAFRSGATLLDELRFREIDFLLDEQRHLARQTTEELTDAALAEIVVPTDHDRHDGWSPKIS